MGTGRGLALLLLLVKAFCPLDLKLLVDLDDAASNSPLLAKALDERSYCLYCSQCIANDSRDEAYRYVDLDLLFSYF